MILSITFFYIWCIFSNAKRVFKFVDGLVTLLDQHLINQRGKVCQEGRVSIAGTVLKDTEFLFVPNQSEKCYYNWYMGHNVTQSHPRKWPIFSSSKNCLEATKKDFFDQPNKRCYGSDIFLT